MSKSTEDNYQKVKEDEAPEFIPPFEQKNTDAYQDKMSLWKRYDPIFLFTYSVQSFNGGLKFLFMLAYQDLFKNYYKLQPTHTQLLTTVIFFPWITKFFYGIIADSVPIFGSRKKSWLVIMGLIQFFALQTAGWLPIENPNYMAIVLMTMSFSGAFIDVIMDALMVIESKKNPKSGSQELLSLAWMIGGIAAIIGGVTAAFVLQYFSPFVCFLIYSVFGLVIALTSLMIPARLEEDQDTLEAQLGGPVRTFRQELVHNYHIVKDCLKIKEMYRSLIFFVLIGMTVPRFDDFMYYFKTGPAGFSQFTYSLLTLLGAFALLTGIVIYQKFFKDTEPRIMIGGAMCLTMLASFFDMCFVLRWNLVLGIPDILWVVCSSTAMGTLIFAFLILPPGVLFAKLTPAHVEATMYAFTSSIASAVFPMSKFLGVFLNKMFFNVTVQNLDSLYKLYILQICLGGAPFLYIWLLPTWAEVTKVQEHLKEQVNEKNKELEQSINLGNLGDRMSQILLNQKQQNESKDAESSFTIKKLQVDSKHK